MNILPDQLSIDVVGGKCCVFEKNNIVYSCDKAFEALNYIIFNGYKTIYISDVADLWLDMESYEYCADAIKEKQYLFSKCA